MSNNLPLKVICDTSDCTGIDREVARAELESAFCLSAGEANDFLNGNVVFCRSVANDDIARKYKLAFGRIGLKCTIAENSSLRQKTMMNLTLITDKMLTEAIGQPAINDPLPEIEKEPSEPIITDVSLADPMFNPTLEPLDADDKPVEAKPVEVKPIKEKKNKKQAPGLAKKQDETTPTSATTPTIATEDQTKEQEHQKEQVEKLQTEEGDIATTKRKNEAVWATNLIYVACFFYLLTATPLEMVENVIGQAALPLPIFYLPFLVGTVFVTLSCIFLVKLKGYPIACAALGIGGPVGLGTTLLLPNKLLGEKFNALDKHNYVGYFLIVAGLLWLLSPSPVKIDPQPYIQRADVLSLGRNVYPATTLDNLDEVLPTETAELRAYLDDGLELIKKVGDDDNSVAQVSKAMFTEVSNLLQWLHYQRVLASQAGKKIYIGKGDDSIQILVREFVKQLQQGATRIGNERFNQQIQLWLAPSKNPPTGDMQVLYSDLVDTKLLFLRSGRKIDESFTLEDFDLPGFSSANIQVKNSIITLKLKSSDLALDGASIIVAFHPQAYTRRGIEGYDIMIEHIGGTLPNYQLPGWLNYFSGISD